MVRATRPAPPVYHPCTTRVQGKGAGQALYLIGTGQGYRAEV